MAVLLEVVSGVSGMKVDRDAGVIHDVLILGRKSRNGRNYSAQAMQKAVSIYESKVVNVGHPPRTDPKKERTFDERFGWLAGVRESTDGLRGDLHYLKSDPRAEKFCEAAERNPSMFGLSHNAEGRLVRHGSEVIVEEIQEVRSVDIVSDPATTRTLFESFDSEGSPEMDQPMPEAPAGSGDMTLQMFQERVGAIFSGEGDPASKAKAIGNLAKTLLKVKDELDNAGKPAEKPADALVADAGKETMESLQAEIKTLKAEKEVGQLFESLGVKPSEIQRKAVLALESKEDRQALIESYKATGKSGDEKPKSASPLLESREDTPAPADSKTFAKSLTRGR
jgi:hypothetical protein